jgi:hypothetical protein
MTRTVVGSLEAMGNVYPRDGYTIWCLIGSERQGEGPPVCVSECKPFLEFWSQFDRKPDSSFPPEKKPE